MNAVVGTFGIITNAIFAHYILTEWVTMRDIIAIGVIITGGVLALIGNHGSIPANSTNLGMNSTSSNQELQQIKEYFQNPGTHLYDFNRILSFKKRVFRLLKNVSYLSESQSLIIYIYRC